MIFAEGESNIWLNMEYVPRVLKLKLDETQANLAGSCQPVFNYSNGKQDGEFIVYPAQTLPGIHCEWCPFNKRCSESTLLKKKE